MAFSGFPTRILYEFISPMRTGGSVCLISHDLMALIIFSEEYNSVLYPLLDTNNFLSTLFLNTLSLFFP
jgi:hypothetical protein